MYSTTQLPHHHVAPQLGEAKSITPWMMAVVVLCGAVIYLFMGLKPAALVTGGGLAVIGIWRTHAAVFLLFMVLAIEPLIPLIPGIGSISKPVGALVLISYLCHISQYGFKLDRLLITLVVFLFFAVASAIWATSIWFTGAGILTLFLNLSIIIILCNIMRTSQDLHLACAGLIAGALTAALLIKLGFGEVQGQFSGTLSRRMSLGEESPVRVAYCLLLGWLSICYFCVWVPKIWKIVFAGLGAFILYSMLATQSRTALGAAVVAPAIGFLLVADRKSLFKLMQIYLLLMIVGIVVYIAIFYSDILPREAKERMRRNPAQDLGDSGRTYIWITGIKMFFSSPLFGVGFKNFTPVIGVGKDIASAHNNLISILAELGIIGTSLIISVHYMLLKRIRQAKATPLGWLAASMFCYTILIGLTATTYHDKHFWYAFGVAIAATLISQAQQNRANLILNHNAG